MVGTPCYGRQVTDAYTGSLLKLLLACQRRGVRLAVNMAGSDALITRARQNIAANFLANEGATHLLFVDADIGFEPDQVFRLLEFDAPVTGGIYPLKRLDWRRIAEAAGAAREPLESVSLEYTLTAATARQSETRNGFARVSYAATGFLMIRRDALEAMVAHYPELRYTQDHRPEDPLSGSPWRCALFNCMIDEQTGVYLSEDFSFCKRWTDMDGEIWVDLQSRLSHIGTMELPGDFTTQFSSAGD